MFYLLLSISCSLTIAIILKNAQKHVGNKIAMFMANYMICVLCGLYYNGIPVFNKDSGFSLFLGVFSGFMYLAAFVISDIDISKNGMVMQTVFAKLGLLVSMTLSIILFGEIFNLKQGFGMVIAIAAIILIYFEKGSTSTVTAKHWLIINLISSGLSDVMVSIYTNFGNPLYKDQFLLLNFFFALMFSIAFVIYQKKKVALKDLLFGFMIGVPNYFSARFMMQALNTVPSIIAHPIVSIGAIASITLVGHFVFKEDLTMKKWIALAMIAVAIVFLS